VCVCSLRGCSVERCGGLDIISSTGYKQTFFLFTLDQPDKTVLNLAITNYCRQLLIKHSQTMGTEISWGPPTRSEPEQLSLEYLQKCALREVISLVVLCVHVSLIRVCVCVCVRVCMFVSVCEGVHLLARWRGWARINCYFYSDYQRHTSTLVRLEWYCGWFN
jgi:hypothetical protein